MLPTKEQIQAEKARRSLLNFTTFTFPDYQVNWHHRLLANKLTDFLNSPHPSRLMIFMPPRYGKTELASRRFPAFALGRNPNTKIIACSYAKTLSSDINRDVQRIIDTPTYRKVFPHTKLFGKNVRTSSQTKWLRNNDIFEIVNHRGFYKSAGVGGGITGKGYDIGIIDDPIKNAEAAYSPTIREKIWEWYTTTFYTRRENNAKIIIIMTRWHEDDLAGRLLSLDDDSEFAENWEVIKLRAMKEEPAESTPHDPREPGEPLWPEKFSAEDIKIARKTQGERKFNALQQQKPRTTEEGALWNYDIIKRGIAYPDLVRVVVSIDPATTSKSTSDLTGMTVQGIDERGYGYLIEDLSGKMTPNQWANKAISAFHRYEADRIVAEINQGGDMVESTIRSVDPSIPYRGVHATRGKQLRAEPVAALYEQGKIIHVKDKFKELEEQLCTWEPGDRSPNRLDALVQGFTELFFYTSGKSKVKASTG